MPEGSKNTYAVLESPPPFLVIRFVSLAIFIKRFVIQNR